jgi:hypothetical protein
MVNPRQALPVTKAQLLALRVPPMLKLALWLAWKTASRWDEIAKLTGASFTQIAESGVSIAFSTKGRERPKNAYGQPYQAHFFVLVRDKEPATMKWACELLRKVAPTAQPFRAWTTSAVESVLATIPLTPAHQALVDDEMANGNQKHPTHYTAHSIKKGALGVLVDLVADGVLPPSVLSLLGKHAPTAPIVENNTIRYVHEHPRLGEAIGTGDVTYHL